jgi:hypothetical protein
MVQGVWLFNHCSLNVKDGQRSDRPSTSADPVQNIDAAVQAARRVNIAHLELKFNLSWGTIWDIVHERLGYKKVCSRWLPRHLTEKHKSNTHGNFLYASSTLRRTWWSILTHNCYRRWELALPLHHREQGWLDDLKASSLSSQKEVQKSAVFRKGVDRYFLGCLCIGTCERHGAINHHWHWRTLRYHKPALAHADFTVPQNCIGTCGRHGAINLHWHMRKSRQQKPALEHRDNRHRKPTLEHTDITVP